MERKKLEGKTLLEMYRAEKLDIRRGNFYDYSKGSSLLFEAGAGCLRTKSFVGKYTQNDRGCTFCRKEINSIVLECEGIQLNLDGNIRLPGALRFKGSTEGVNFKAIEATKRTLVCWWTKSRKENIA